MAMMLGLGARQEKYHYGDEMGQRPISVYPVGWMAAWNERHMGTKLSGEWRYFRRQFKARNWRALRNTFNGYLAEPEGEWPVCWFRCGHGWTKRRAVRNLFRHMADEV